MATKKSVAKKRVSTGGCLGTRTKPNVSVGAPLLEVINLALPLEEALKLMLAIDECAHRVNRYKRSTNAGKAQGVILSFKPAIRRIDVFEGLL